MSERWVCHKSGQGEKWKVAENYKSKSSWCVYAKDETEFYHYLPQSEYIECDPPEVWVECTRNKVEIYGSDCRHLITLANSWTFASLDHGYHWAWRDNALVIERRQA